MSRFAAFSKSLLANDFFQVRFLARYCVSDKRTTLAKCLHRIADFSGFNGDITKLTSEYVRKNMIYYEIQQNEKGRISVIKDMLDILNKRSPSYGLSETDAAQILEHVCTS